MNFDKVSSLNAKIPRYLTTLTGIRRELEILKWKLSKDVMSKRDMQQRYNYILKRIALVEDKLENINKTISASLMEYENVEKVNTNIAKKF